MLGVFGEYRHREANPKMLSFLVKESRQKGFCHQVKPAWDRI